MVEVEEGRLRPLEEDLAALVHGVVDHADGVAHHGLDPWGVLAQVVVGDVAGGQGEAVVDLGQDGVLLLEDDIELLAEDLGVEEVLDPQADPRRLVGVRRADAPLGRAEGVLAEKALGHPIELLVVRHDQVGVAAHDQPADVDAPCRQAVELLEQDGRVDDDAVADDRRDVLVEDAARHQLEREGLAVDDDAVAGVVATLVAHHHVHLAGNEVGELALPLVAPLGPDHHGCGHAPLRSLRRFGLRTSVPPGTGALGVRLPGPRTARRREERRRGGPLPPRPAFSCRPRICPGGPALPRVPRVARGRPAPAARRPAAASLRWSCRRCRRRAC